MTKLSLWKVFSRMSNRWACNWWSVAGRRACKRAWGLNKKTAALRCVAFVDCSPAAKEPRSWKEANIHLMSDITYRDAYLLEMQTTTSPPSHVSSTCPYIRPIVFQFKFVLHSRITFCLNGKLRNARKKKKTAMEQEATVRTVIEISLEWLHSRLYMQNPLNQNIKRLFPLHIIPIPHP